MVYIGVDPGKSGAFCGIFDDHVEVYPWDNVDFIAFLNRIIYSGDGVKAAVEKVGAFSGQGVTSCFTFGYSAGFIAGVLSALGIPYQLVPPRVWKKVYSLDSDKAKSIDACHRLFPELSLRKTEKCRTDSADLAEAALIAEWCRRNM